MGDLEISSVKACLSLLSIKHAENITPEFAIHQLDNVKAELSKLKLQIVQLSDQTEESISMWKQIQKKQPVNNTSNNSRIESVVEKPDAVPLPKKKIHFRAISWKL